MKEQIVSFELAKLAKEKGFREPCSHYYFADGEFKEHEVIKDGGIMEVIIVLALNRLTRIGITGL